MQVVTTHDRSQPATVGSIALTVVVVMTAAVDAWGATGALIVTVLTLAAAAALVDARSGRIPDPLVAAAVMPTLLVVASSAIAGSGAHALATVALGCLAFAGPVFAVHLISPDAMGFGDVKLAAVLGAALGLVDPRLGLLALCLAAAVTAAVGLVRRRRSLPFGPGLVLGATAAVLIAGQIGDGLRWR